jgi:hypothetical protein
VNDAARVGSRHGVRHRKGDAQQIVQAEPVARDERVEAGAAHILHHDEVDVAFRLDLVDRDDAGMVQRGRGLRLLEEATPAILVVHPVGGQNLMATSRPSRVSRAR